jgi:hypothetical protein
MRAHGGAGSTVQRNVAGVFSDFWRLFYPRISRRLDFSQMTFLDKETFTDLPEGSQREADLVVRVNTRSGEPRLILIHIEVESSRRGTFPARMFEYYMLLRLRYRIDVLPVVIYLAPGAGGVTWETHAEGVFGEKTMRFRYRAVGLPDLNAADYETLTNPLAPALSAWMRSAETDRVARWLRILQQEARLPLNPAQQALLVNIVERALPLSDAETERLQQEVNTTEEVRRMETIFQRWGRAEGKIIGKQETLLRLAGLRFGRLPDAVRERIQATNDEATLDAALDRVLTASTPEDLFADESRPDASSDSNGIYHPSL